MFRVLLVQITPGLHRWPGDVQAHVLGAGAEVLAIPGQRQITSTAAVMSSLARHLLPPCGPRHVTTLWDFSKSNR